MITYCLALLEMLILLHGTVVAYFQGILDGVLSTTFLTSFSLLFVMSVFWGLPVVRTYLKNGNRSIRYWGLLTVTLILYAVFAYNRFAAGGKLVWIASVLELPALYYLYALWYYGFYLSGKWVLSYLVRNGLIREKGFVDEPFR
jgi:hypothetical protein